MRYISQKIFFAFLSLILLFSALMLWVLTNTVTESFRSTFVEDLKKFTSVMSDPAIEYIREGKQSELTDFLADFSDKTSIRFTIIKPDGTVLADSYADPDTMDNHALRDEVIEASTNGTGVSFRYSNTLGKYMLYYAEAMDIESSPPHVVRLSFFAEDINKVTGRVKEQIFLITLLLVVISVIGIYFFSQSITKPIVKLTEASKEIALGNFDVSVSVGGRDEVSNLAGHFNEMTRKNRELFEKITRQKEDYRTLIASIKEGLLVLNKDLTVLHFNKGIQESLGVVLQIGKSIDECVLSPEAEETIRTIVEEGKNSVKNISSGDKYFMISAVPMENREEMVLLFHDMTDLKKIEMFKQDFIVNVSHELRTPLTAIKGFVETLEDELEDEDDNENLYYLDIINRHTDRLINIVQDLLILAEVEQDSLQLLLTKTDIRKLPDNILSIYEPKAKEKGIEIIKNIPDTPCEIAVDSFRIEQVLVNLVDNAIKYTDEGHVSLTVENKDEAISIIISDTGCGIEGEDKSRVFERFYRVDKSRSRKAGGTGLGLSIVKHIVLQHNGTIEVESEPGIGTTFIISLPKEELA